MAWLETKPEGARRGRLKDLKIKKARGHPAPGLEMPPVEYGQYLIEYLFEAGPFENGGFGPTPISWRELKAWEDMRGIMLTAWEAGVIRALSQHYVAQLRESTNPNCPPPYAGTELSKAEIAESIDRFFSKMERKQERESRSA
ncbi:hypothetical protein ACVA51_10725 [Pseudomonas luteola]